MHHKKIAKVKKDKWKRSAHGGIRFHYLLAKYVNSEYDSCKLLIDPLSTRTGFEPRTAIKAFDENKEQSH